MSTVFSTAVVEIPVTTTVLNVESTQTEIVELGLIGPQGIFLIQIESFNRITSNGFNTTNSSGNGSF